MNAVMRLSLLILCVFNVAVLARADEPKPKANEGVLVVEDFADLVIQQHVPQMRHVVQTELRFVHTVCEPTPEQFQKLEAAANKEFNDALKKLAAAHGRMQRVQVHHEGQDPRRLIAEQMLKSVREALPAAQAAHYEAELAKRREARKRAAVLNMVAYLDRQLGLTAEQRGKLVETLTTQWQDAWVDQLEVFLYGEDFVPVPPQDVVLPVLNAKQREIWKSTPPRPTLHMGFAAFNFVNVIDVEGEPPAIEIPEPKP